MRKKIKPMITLNEVFFYILFFNFIFLHIFLIILKSILKKNIEITIKKIRTCKAFKCMYLKKVRKQEMFAGIKNTRISYSHGINVTNFEMKHTFF